MLRGILLDIFLDTRRDLDINLSMIRILTNVNNLI